MQIWCNECKKLVEFLGASIGRRDSCGLCGSDLRVCLNCQFYDETAYNQCVEPGADRVLDKHKSNYCEFFKVQTNLPRDLTVRGDQPSEGVLGSHSGSEPKSQRDILRERAEALFKKK